MSLSLSASSFLVPSESRSFARRRNGDLVVFFFSSPRRFSCRPRSKAPRILRLSSSLATSSVDLSWVHPEPDTFTDDYGGWAVVETPGKEKKKGLSPVLVSGLGSAVALGLAAVAYFSVHRKGFRLKLSSPLHTLYAVFRGTEIEGDKTESEDSLESDGKAVAVDSKSEFIATATSRTVPSDSASEDKYERILGPVAVDSTQQEALSILKKLEIIKDDANANRLCTRREYVRWLVHVSSMLERKPNYRIVPSVAISGSVDTAFDDVGIEDPDFESIQALAETGIVPSKLSGKSTRVDDSQELDKISFCPEGFISRQDLINWKASIEYEFGPEKLEQMLRMKVEYIDLKDTPDSSPGLFMDMLAGEKSIVRKVFGKSRRLQPTKPSTKAQAAVALTSGRMKEAIQDELLRLEAESSSRKVEMEEIRSVLLARGEIQKYWDKRIEEERARAAEAEHLYLSLIRELEQNKIIQEKWFAESLKEKAAMDCQRQLLLNLQEEVDQMSKRLVTERAMYISEHCTMKNMISQLQFKQEEMLKTKSVLEAEIEAINILRSWVEDEARKSQARAKVLEEVGRRWRWDDEA